MCYRGILRWDLVLRTARSYWCTLRSFIRAAIVKYFTAKYEKLPIAKPRERRIEEGSAYEKYTDLFGVSLGSAG